MKINEHRLTKKDIGRWVTYRRFDEEKIGRIKSWNKKYIFVVYKCNYNWENFENYTGVATEPEDLELSEKCPVCEQFSLLRSEGYYDGQQQISPDIYYCTNCGFQWEQDCRPEYSIEKAAQQFINKQKTENENTGMLY